MFIYNSTLEMLSLTRGNKQNYTAHSKEHSYNCNFRCSENADQSIPDQFYNLTELPIISPLYSLFKRLKHRKEVKDV